MKQVDYDIRVWNLSATGAEDGTQTRLQMLEYLHTNYPTVDGWVLESVTPAGVHGGAISMVTFMVKYAEKVTSDTVPTKAK
jgi:hypothetical protein